MTHQIHIKEEGSRQWVKAALALGYLKEGLAPFCEDIAKEHHANIRQETRCLDNHATCQSRDVSSKSVCGSMYDIIKERLASGRPNLKNTEPQQWMTDPWSIAKCYIFTTGYEQKTSAADTDITGLLHVIINNKYFHYHVSCNMTGPNIFLKVREYRDKIFLSSTQKFNCDETNKYIDDMIAVLQDSKELIQRQDAKEAVKKLQDLQMEVFVITTDLKSLEYIREELKLIMQTTEVQSTKVELRLKDVILENAIHDLQQEINKRKVDYDLPKADLQKKLLKTYRDYLLQMPAMPCHPDHVCNFEDVYVTPKIILKTKDEDGKNIETKVNKVSDIFFKDGKPLQTIYIVGEAGSGKSSFCKSLISCWCKAHSDTHNLDGQKVEYNTEDHADLIKVMKKYNFLFFIFLREFTHKVSISDMLEEEYDKHPVLIELLQCASETCLIVLDGLDEWTSTSSCLPKRANSSNYTVLTTSRPWKIESLGISEIIYLNGFDDTSRTKMITNILKILQEQYPDKKRAKDKDSPKECERTLVEEPFRSMTHTAMMLQQLICLWFEDRLNATSRCNLYTCMLDLFFVWYKQKDPKSLEKLLEKSYGLAVPEYLNNTDECESHIYIIRNVSRLAYETLIKNEKKTSLTFDSSMFIKLEIYDIKECCLGLGILSEGKGQRLSPSRSRKSHISFIHKSVQEYLAAMHIVWKIQKEKESSTDTENADVSKKLSQMLNVKTLDELLEQENVLIMLCGMDTMVAKSVSKLIYNIVAKDDRVVRYRKTIHYDFRNVHFIQHIQTFILDCAEETKASFDLGDLVLNWDPYDQYDLRIIGKIEQNITLDNVLSFNIDKTGIMNHDVSNFDCMMKFKNLKTIKIRGDFDEDMHKRSCDSIEANASTLEFLTLTQVDLHGEHTLLFLHIAKITHLVALRVEAFTVTHEDITSLCTFLSGTGNLQQISIDIKCECKGQHEVDLSKHEQLQYLKYSDHVVVTNAVSTNLEMFHSPQLNENNCIKVLDFLSNSLKMKDLFLQSDFPSNESRTDSMGQYDHETILTRKLTQVILSTQQLRVLNLRGFTFTDNIITCPSEMMSLESIDVSFGVMSLTTWKKFVDSVAELPQRVEVTARDICITRDGEEFNPGEVDKRRGGEEADAFRYVQEREKFFHTLHKIDSSIQFSTKK